MEKVEAFFVIDETDPGRMVLKSDFELFDKFARAFP
jgi:hypothetical protein